MIENCVDDLPSYRTPDLNPARAETLLQSMCRGAVPLAASYRPHSFDKMAGLTELLGISIRPCRTLTADARDTPSQDEERFLVMRVILTHATKGFVLDASRSSPTLCICWIWADLLI